MPPGFSTWLDALRVAAALTVFASHLSDPRFSGGRLGIPLHAGHSAVVVFFVLSGYVIAWTVAGRERDWRSYAAARAARLYSVAVPALLLTNFVDLSLRATAQATAVPWYQYAHYPAYLALFLAFGSDAWFLRETAFSNPAYWSLTYEVAYYAAFGVLMFLTGYRRVAALAVVLALTGPRPWLLAPVWIAGALLARAHGQRGTLFRQTTARLLAAVTLAAIVAVVAAQAGETDDRLMAFLSGSGDAARAFWRYSRFAPGDLLLGALVALHLAAAHDAAVDLAGPLAIVVRAAAARTFTLYLVHVPLLEFWSAWLAPPPWLLVVLVLGFAWLVGSAIEPQRARLRRLFQRALPVPA